MTTSYASPDFVRLFETLVADADAAVPSTECRFTLVAPTSESEGVPHVQESEHE